MSWPNAKKPHDYREEGRLRNAISANAARPEGYGRLAAWLARAGRLAQAREALQDGLAHAGRPARLHHLLGLIVSGAGDWESGIRHLERAVVLENDRFEYVRDLAFARGAAGRTASSVAALGDAIRLAGADGQALTWLLRLGQRAMAEGGGRAARRPPTKSPHVAAVEKLVAREPEVVEALIPRKGVPGPAGRETLRAARRALVRLADEHVGYADLYFGLSVVNEELGELNRAIASVEKALGINPNYVEACLLAVRLYEKAGNAQRAEERCRHAAELRPEWADVHVRLGTLLRTNGRLDEAGEAYRRALDLGADGDEVRAYADAGAEAGPTQGGDA